MKKTRIKECSIALGLVIAIIVSITGFGMECNDIRSDIVRLHILANSDSDADQRVKLLIRDALLNCGEDIFSGVVNVKNAEEILNTRKNELIEIANNVLDENGMDYQSDVYLSKEYFTTRSYENFTLPAGEYMALKVILGEGKGHNWWCVMFPPLCLPAASEKVELDVVFGESGAEMIENGKKFEMRFKIIELIEGLKFKLKK